MTVNYLILAHANFSHLQRLIDALDGDDVNFFLHIDARVRQLPDLRQEKIVFLKRRYKVGWGSFNMIRATLELYRVAHADIGKGRYVLLSGADYPIKPDDQLRAKLQSDAEFVDLGEVPLPANPLSRYEKFYFSFDRKNRSLMNWALAKAEGVINDRIRVRRKIPFKLYAGSQWMALSHACVSHILDTVKSDRRYIAFFQHSLIPDEAFFQTVIGNSHYRGKCAPNLTYADWTSDPAPAMIGEQHVRALKECPALDGSYGSPGPFFIRKLDDNTASIVDLIDRDLRR